VNARIRSLWGLLPALVFIDQATKIVVDRIIPLYGSVPVIEGFFNLTYIRNSGAAFGIFAELSGSFSFSFLCWRSALLSTC